MIATILDGDHGAHLAAVIDSSVMMRALAGCLALSIGLAPLGVFLMLRRMSLAGDAISHAILPGVAVGYLVAGISTLPMALGGLIAGVIVALLAGIVARTTPLREDASLAAFTIISLALGVVMVSHKGSSEELLHVLFGSVLTLDNQALALLGLAAVLTPITLAVIYRALVAECVDSSFLARISPAGGIAHLTFLCLVVVNLVASLQALGTLLSVGMMMLPAIIARFWARTLNGMMAAAVLIAALSSVAGLLIAAFAGTPPEPTIILAAGALYIASLFVGRIDGLLWRSLPQKHRTA